jgi:hypothetical protein
VQEIGCWQTAQGKRSEGNLGSPTQTIGNGFERGDITLILYDSYFFYYQFFYYTKNEEYVNYVVKVPTLTI